VSVWRTLDSALREPQQRSSPSISAVHGRWTAAAAVSKGQDRRGRQPGAPAVVGRPPSGTQIVWRLMAIEIR
jgi:hypothetical protein